MPLSSVCVFAASTSGTRPEYVESASTIGRLAGERGITVVCGGGATGLMGALADAALSAGGHVIGVIPRHLVDSEGAHPALTELRLVDTMAERKALMAELAEAFIALPGGIGTLEELIEVLSWSKLGLHDKPCAVLDVAGYYAPLAQMFDHAVDEEFLSAQARALLTTDSDADALLTQLAAHRERN